MTLVRVLVIDEVTVINALQSLSAQLPLQIISAMRALAHLKNQAHCIFVFFIFTLKVKLIVLSFLFFWNELDRKYKHYLFLFQCDQLVFRLVSHKHYFPLFRNHQLVALLVTHNFFFLLFSC